MRPHARRRGGRGPPRGALSRDPRRRLRPGSVPRPGAHVETGDEDALLDRLADAGYRPLYDDPAEDVPKHERARSQHRRAVLASLTAAPEVAPTPATDALLRCWACPVLAHVSGARAALTVASLANLATVAEDDRLRRHLDEDDVAAIMARRPA